MASAVEIIKERIDLAIEKKLSQSTLQKVRREIQNYMDKFMLERLNAGLDVNGNKIKAFKPKYKRFKEKWIKRRINHRATSKNKAWFKKLYDTTQYAAKSMPNYGRLTGKTLMSLNPEVTKIIVKNGKIEFQAELQTLASGKTRKPAETELIIDGLKKRGRDYYSLLAKPTTNRGKKEREIIMSAIKKLLKI